MLSLQSKLFAEFLQSIAEGIEHITLFDMSAVSVAVSEYKPCISVVIIKDRLQSFFLPYTSSA